MASHRRNNRRTSIHHLDDGVLKDEIFTRLPLSTQWTARSVCKHWRSLLMTTRNHAQEKFVIVNAIDHLLFYNVSRRRWMKPRPLDSIPLPLLELEDPSMCCVFEELVFFRDQSEPPRIAMWNTITDETRVLNELDPVPGDEDEGILEFGAYMNKKTGELKMMVFNYFDFDYPDGVLYVWDEKNKWTISRSKEGTCHGPNFNYRNGQVTFLDNGPIHVQQYDVVSNSYTRVAWAEVNEPGENEAIDPAYLLPGSLGIWLDTHIIEPSEMFDWDTTHYGARFHLEGLGIYLIGSLKMHLELEEDKDLGVLWFNPAKKALELVSESPPDMISDMYVIGHNCRLMYCSDGLENIWVLAPGSSTMARFNVVSRVWVSLPSILNRFAEYGLEMTRGALYTIF